MQKTTPYNINLHNIKIGSNELSKYGCFLKKDYILNYNIVEEFEKKYIPGRDTPYFIKKRKLPIEISIEFDFKVNFDFNTRYLKLEKLLSNSNGEVLTFNNEETGFIIYKTFIENVTRGIGQDKVTIYFMFEPKIVDCTTKEEIKI